MPFVRALPMFRLVGAEVAYPGERALKAFRRSRTTGSCRVADPGELRRRRAAAGLGGHGIERGILPYRIAVARTDLRGTQRRRSPLERAGSRPPPTRCHLVARGID